MPVPREKPHGFAERLPVFVYGTLRPGQKNYPRFLAGRTVEELPATARGRLYFARCGGYPFLLPGTEVVVGSLMVLAPEHYTTALNKLDRLEDYDPDDERRSLYLRRRTRVILADASRITAWVYYWNRPEITGKRIESGDFCRLSDEMKTG